MGADHRLKVLFLAAEAAPLIKVGGLGDVAGSLPLYLSSLNLSHKRNDFKRIVGRYDELDIRLVIPFHRSIQTENYELNSIVAFYVASSKGKIKAEIYSMKIDDLTVDLISGEPFMEGDAVYSQDPAEDGFKYTFFSLASLQFVKDIGWRPDIIHANDWHTAPAIYATSLNRKDESFFNQPATLLEVHNLPYMGAGVGESLRAFGLPPALGSGLPEWAQDLPLPLGLLAADHIVTVSPTYAEEILTPEFGAGLNDFLLSRQASISGILNGIDVERWNPETDEHIHRRYCRTTLTHRISNKEVLLKEFNLSPELRRPLLALVTRLDYQKGADLAFEALRNLSDQDWNAIILGTGDSSLEDNARRLEADFPDRVRAVIQFDSPLSHRIYAGADMLIIPSRYEPCGLTQMIAMIYGSVPIGRSTGGLKDTILDYDNNPKGTGFIFKTPTAESLEEAIRRAINTYRDQRRWRGLQRRGMQGDFSWESSARKYLKLYHQLADRMTP